MLLKEFYSGNNDCTKITAEQGSLFAKEIANDFNPLHDVDAKRFCVPGDLLFAIVLEKYGLSKKMNFRFTGMMGHGVDLIFNDTEADQFDVDGSNGKTIVKVERSGDRVSGVDMVNQLSENYVAFSGHNFPYILVPLMAKQQVMINLTRPLVLYDSMALEFDHLDFSNPTVEMLDPELKVDGKRGEAYFYFQIKANDKIVGKGFKKILISGMREYEEAGMQEFVDTYLARKQVYLDSMES